MSTTNKAKSQSAPVPVRRTRVPNHKAAVREASIARILDAAEQLFAEFGYHGVTLKDVAARVGISSTLSVRQRLHNGNVNIPSHWV